MTGSRTGVLPPYSVGYLLSGPAHNRSSAVRRPPAESHAPFLPDHPSLLPAPPSHHPPEGRLTPNHLGEDQQRAGVGRVASPGPPDRPHAPRAPVATSPPTRPPASWQLRPGNVSSRAGNKVLSDSSDFWTPEAGRASASFLQAVPQPGRTGHTLPPPHAPGVGAHARPSHWSKRTF